MASQVAIVGFGRVGSTLANFFHKKGKDVLIISRRAHKLEKTHPNFRWTVQASKIQVSCDLIVLCTPKTVTKELLLNPNLNGKDVVYTSAGLPFSDISDADIFLARLIPSVGGLINCGDQLFSFPVNMDTLHRQRILSCFEGFGHLIEVEERQLEWGMITDGLPAVICALAKDLSTCKLPTNALITLGKLLEAGISMGDIINWVCTPNGIVEAAISDLREGRLTFREFGEKIKRNEFGI